MAEDFEQVILRMMREEQSNQPTLRMICKALTRWSGQETQHVADVGQTANKAYAKANQIAQDLAELRLLVENRLV